MLAHINGRVRGRNGCVHNPAKTVKGCRFEPFRLATQTRSGKWNRL